MDKQLTNAQLMAVELYRSMRSRILEPYFTDPEFEELEFDIYHVGEGHFSIAICDDNGNDELYSFDVYAKDEDSFEELISTIQILFYREYDIDIYDDNPIDGKPVVWKKRKR